MTAPTPEDLFAYLSNLGIAHHTVSHPPLFTVADSQALRGDLPGGHAKNLFLKDKKDQLFLVVALEDRPVTMRPLEKLLGAARLSFGRPELLGEVLGVQPGAVTPFGLLHPESRRLSSVLIDAGLLAHERVHFHPLVNSMTTALAPADLLRFVEACGHRPVIHDLGQLAPAGPLEARA